MRNIDVMAVNKNYLSIWINRCNFVRNIQLTLFQRVNPTVEKDRWILRGLKRST